MKRIRFILLITGLIISVFSFSQTIDLNLKATMLRNSGNDKKGSEVILKQFIHKTIEEFGEPTEVYYIESESGNKIEVNKKLDDTFEFHYSNIQDFWDAAIINNVLYNLKKSGNQYKLRKDMEDDALGYIQKVKEYNLEFNDPYLENYIYSLTAKIAPERLLDGRPSSINILIQQNPSINACTYPNGTIVLNTGLLSILHSEDELVAILAHEIAHFVLDHSIINVNMAEKRAKRAEFWSAVLTGVTAVAEGVAASKNKYYIPGAATIGVAALSSSISSQVLKRLGMEYNHEQELEADKMAIEVLKYLGYEENALATALSRIEEQYIIERNNAVYINSYTHPALVRRIKKCGTPTKETDASFEQMVSFATTNLAIMKYDDRRYSQCLPLVSQNIKNNVATSDDFIIKAKCLLALKNTPESNNEVLSLIAKAKAIGTGSMINVYSTEIVANLRLNKKDVAITLLNEYIENLHLLEIDSQKIISEQFWEQTRSYVNKETDWAKRMLVKLQGMM